MTDAPIGTGQIPLTYKQSAAVCIFHKNSVCLGRRTLKCQLTGNDNSFGGYWSPFGGLVEEGENPMLGAVRELKEETEIEINPFDLQYMQQLNNEDGFIYILYAFHSDELLLPRLNFEHDESGYFRITSLQNSPSPMCPRVVEAILSYERRRWKGN